MVWNVEANFSYPKIRILYMELYHLSTLDLIIILLYIVGVLLLGMLISRTHESSEDYFLASRSMTWPLIGISLFASNISSTTLVGLSGFAYRNDISVFNYEWMAAVVLVIFVWFFLPYYIKTRVYTVPEFLEKRFDQRSRYLFSILTLFLNIVVDTAGSLFAGGLVLKLVFPDWPLWTIITGLALVAGIYTIAGGLKAVIYTDVLQTVLLLIGSCIISYVALHQVGGWDSFIHRVPVQDLSLIRPLSDPNMPWLGLISGVLIIGFYFWGMNQFIVQRVLSARDIQHARWGALFAGFLKLPVLFIMVLPGVMARYIFPDLENQDLVFPTLMFNLLPMGVLGLVLAGLIAALMSSIDSTLNSASTLVTMDFVQKFRPQLGSEQLMWVGRVVTFIFMLLAVLWAPQIEKFPSLFNYLQHVLSYAVSPVVAILVLGIFWQRMTASGAFYALLLGFGAGALLYIANVILHWMELHFLYIAPILLFISLIAGIIFSLWDKTPVPKEKLALHWSRATFDSETVNLHQHAWYQNYRILSLLLLSCTAILIAVFW